MDELVHGSVSRLEATTIVRERTSCGAKEDDTEYKLGIPLKAQ